MNSTNDKNVVCERCGKPGPLTKNMCRACYGYTRYHESSRRSTIKIDRNRDPYRAHQPPCKLIKEHHEKMKNDPERLTTAFMQKIININCDYE